MNRFQEDVRRFHKEVLDGPTSPAEPVARNPELRARLILEEAVETVVALVGEQRAFEMSIELQEAWASKGESLQEPDLVEAIDGCIDTLYVVFGTLEDIGVDADPFWDEVQRSNMAKAGGEVRADGKRLKPPGWIPPDIAGVLARVRRGAR